MPLEVVRLKAPLRLSMQPESVVRVLLDCWAKAETEMSTSNEIILIARTADSREKLLFVSWNCTEGDHQGQESHGEVGWKPCSGGD